MNNFQMEAGELRKLILGALPEVSTEYGSPPPEHQFFVPKSHARALHVNIPVVLGDRGMGKSYWWSALLSPRHRELLERHAPDARIRRDTLVLPGFGKVKKTEHHPGKEVLDALLDAGFKPRHIWKTVVLQAILLAELKPVAAFGGPKGGLSHRRGALGDYGHPSEIQPFGQGVFDNVADFDDGLWQLRVDWLSKNPETADRILEQADAALHQAGRDLVVVFDALDDASDDTERMYELIEGLCQLALELRASLHLRVKVFLRTDLFEDRRVGRFRDAAKLRASTATLAWLNNELFGLLWQLLCNFPDDARFRQQIHATMQETRFKGRKLSNRKRIELLELRDTEDWTIPSEALFDADTQERIFHQITGPYMGESPRNGFPYEWLPTYLSDALGRISPRSFLDALVRAAQWTDDHERGHGYAIHHRGLREGVSKAAEQRRFEITEHRWVAPLMEALSGQILVPLDFDEVQERWAQRGVFGEKDVIGAEIRSPDEARGRLIQLGVWRQMKTGKIDVPEVYRIGFGLGKRGGVALVKSGEVGR